MKTCCVCVRKFEYATPIESKMYTINYENKNNNNSIFNCTRQTNYCSVSCLGKQALEYTKYFNPDQAFIASIPLDKLEMCQYCGSFSHPSEYCFEYDTKPYHLSNFNSIGNLNGEWTICSGNLLYIILGQEIDLKITKIKYEAKMQKLSNDDIIARTPLIYFWFSETSCEELIDSLSDKETPTVQHEKDVVLKVKPIISLHKHDHINSYVLHQSNRITEPQKIFFPFDIRSENCWWPVSQSHTVVEEICHVPSQPQDFIILKDYNLDKHYFYEQEDLKQEEDEEEKPTIL